MSADLLLADDARLLEQCEQTIERGLATFVDVGRALLDIRDGRLYRQSHATFEAYCGERWNFNDRRASQLIAAAEVSTIVGTGPIGLTPRNEAVARELAPLRNDPDEMREVWSTSVEQHGPSPTASEVRDVRLHRHPTADERRERRLATATERFVEALDSSRFLSAEAEANVTAYLASVPADLRHTLVTAWLGSIDRAIESASRVRAAISNQTTLRRVQ